MKKRSIVVCVIHAVVGAIAGAGSADWYAVWDRAGNTWHEKWTNALNRVEELPKDVQIELLGRAAMIDLKGANADQRMEIARRAQSVLLAMRGHAEHYRDRILAARAQIEKAGGAARDSDRIELENALKGFEVLRHLPSVETVRVLGELLDDERGWLAYKPGVGPDQTGGEVIFVPPIFACNAQHAAHTLWFLPLVGRKPTDRPSYQPEAFASWRQWYRDIAEGRRTFRFEGDPTEYDLDGPASAEKLARIKALREREHDRKERDDRRMAGTATPTGPGSVPDQPAATAPRPPLAAFLTAAGVLLAALAWYLLRRKARTTRQ